MPSNIVAITAAIADAYGAVGVEIMDEVRPLRVYDHLPAAIDDWPAHAFWVGPWRILHATQGGMRIGWTLDGIIFIAPVNEAESDRLLKVLVAQMIDELFRNLTASGTIEDGTVQFQGGARDVFQLADTPWQIQRVQYFIEESFPYAYGLGG